MREYQLPDGTPVPPDLQEKIADDVRSFDAAQTPEAKIAGQVKKIAMDLPRLRAVLNEYREMYARYVAAAERSALAHEVQALVALGYSHEEIARRASVEELIRRFGT